MVGLTLIGVSAALALGVGGQTFLANVILGLFGVFGLTVAIWQWANNIPKEPTQEEYIQKLADIVRRVWIDGVLADALREAEVNIEVEGTPKRAGQSSRYSQYEIIKTVFRQGKEEPEPLPNTPEQVLAAFNHTDRKLLILGAPGSGKSVLLLQLADCLLQEKQAVPVVFNLSSWAVNHGPLTEWIVEELRRGDSTACRRSWPGS